MRNFFSCFQFGSNHQRSTSQPDNQPQSISEEELKRPPSSEMLNAIPHFGEQLSATEGTILVPRPRKPDTAALSFWMNYMQMSTALVNNISSYRSSSSESGDGGIKSEGNSSSSVRMLYPRKLTKEERAAKVQKYLEKKKRKNNEKKIRYQYRQHLADKRIRYQGRFVKASDVKDLILNGAQVTAKDKTELNKLFEEDKDEELMARYNENVKAQKIKPIFKTTYDPSIVNSLSLGARKSSASSDSSGSGINPLITTMKNMDLNSISNEQYCNVDIQTPSILKL